MARKNAKKNPDGGFLNTGLLLVAGLVGGFFLFRFLTRKAKPVAIVVDQARSGILDAFQAVADALVGVQDAAQVVETTNQIVASAEAAIQQTDDEVERIRLRLVQLNAARAEAEALNNPFGLQPSIDRLEERLAELTAVAA